jgi:hypothetical protein
VDDTVRQTRTTVTRFDIEHDLVLKLPACASVVSVAWYDGAARMWVANDPALPKVSRRVKMITTGLDVYGDHWECVGTIIAPGKRVWHVFVERV